MTTTPKRRIGLALLLATVALTACGGDTSDSDAAAGTSDSGAFPVTVTGADGELTLDEQPGTIVSMSATATEMLFAIGAGDQVEAVDDNSNYPEDAPTTDLSAFTPNAEAIAEYSPDLVVLSDDLKVMDAAAVALCRDNNIPIVVFNIRQPGNLAQVIEGGGTATVVQNGD